MQFELNTGTIVVIAAIVIFYLRLGLRNWFTAKNEARKTNVEIKKAIKKGREASVPKKPAEQFSVQVRSWWGVAAAFVLVLAGLAINSIDLGLTKELVSLWYIPVAAGILLLALFIK